MVLIDADKSRMSKENRTSKRCVARRILHHEICFPLCVQSRHSIAAYNLVHTVDRRSGVKKKKKKEVNAARYTCRARYSTARTDTYLVNNVRGMTRTASRRATTAAATGYTSFSQQ